MKAFKLLMIDIRRCRKSMLLNGFFFFIAVMIQSSNSGIGISYLTFAAVILSTQPFLLEQRSESGFLGLLPVTLAERITGRYLFGLLLMLFMLTGSVLLNAVFTLTGDAPIAYFPYQTGIFFGAGLIIIAFQYGLFYGLGKIKSQQVITTLAILPGFAMFFLASFLPERLGSYDILLWLASHLDIIAGVFPIVGIACWVIGIAVSLCLVKRKDLL